jgi:hypothetical protein
VLVTDQPSSMALLLLTVAEQQQVPVAYVTGLQMRRAAGLSSCLCKWCGHGWFRCEG